MPRVVNTSMKEYPPGNDPAEENSAGNDNSTVNQNNENRNPHIQFTNYISYSITPEKVNYSQNSLVFSNGEEDPYSLRSVVDGKVKKYKKDTRTWLHKSSAKVKRKLENAIKNGENDLGVTQAKLTKIDRTNKDCNDLGNSRESINEKKANTSETEKYDRPVHSISNTENVEHKDKHNFNCYRTDNTHNFLAELENDMSFLADSDADLAYSEEESPENEPTKTFSYVENWRQCENKCGASRTESESSLKSGHDICASQTDMDNLGHARTDTDIHDLSDHINHNSDSLESLDMNESGNNIRTAPNSFEISRKIAPAIDIERDSLKESMLDSAVNHFDKEIRNERRIYNTRSCRNQGQRSPIGPSQGVNRKSLRGSQKRHAPEGSTYALRSSTTIKQDVVHEQRRVLKAKRTAGVKKTESSPENTVKIPAHIITTKSANLQLDCQPGTSVSSQPGSSTCNNPMTKSATNQVPTLFVTAGRILYKKMKQNFDKCIIEK